MNDIAVIQKATLYEMADAIIDTTGRTEDFKVRDMPTLIREDVYGKGYTDGYSEAEASFSPMIYGTYMLREKAIVPILDEYVFFDFSIVAAFTYFYNGEDYEYRYIDNISLSDDGYVFITSDGGDYCTVYDGYNWFAEGIGEFPDSRYKIIDVKTPLSVTQDSYDLFMGIVDCNTEETPYAVGESTGIIISESAGIEIGRQAQYDEDWDNFQNYGKRTFYGDAFNRSGFEYIRPKHKVKPTTNGGGYRTFYSASKLKKIESEYFDFSGLVRGTYANDGLSYTFGNCGSLTEIEDVGLSPSYSYNYTFAYDRLLVTIAKITIDENTLFNNTFMYCSELVNLIIEGTIGQNGLDLHWSTKLSNASITSIINALSTTTSGLSITLSKTAKEAAFTTNEWATLIATRTNWTINLA